MTLPAVVIRPILSAPASVNQRLPSGPTVIPAAFVGHTSRELGDRPRGDASDLPGLYSVNQRLPSGPATIPNGWLPAVIPVENSVTVPAAPAEAAVIIKVATSDAKISAKARRRDPEMWRCVPTSKLETDVAIPRVRICGLPTLPPCGSPPYAATKCDERI